jgi:hypothetical protein
MQFLELCTTGLLAVALVVTPVVLVVLAATAEAVAVL